MKQENIQSDPCLLPQYRGKPQAEKLFYMFTIVITKQNNTLSGYQFENFVSSYPKK
jgi:outer membrane protein assembly factor BamD